MSSLDTRLEHASWLEIASSIRDFLAHFKARQIEDSRQFSCGFRSETEICRKGLFFKKAFTLTAHHLSLNKIERNYGFTLFKYFVNYTPGFKLKLFSIIVNIKINASKSNFFV